MKNMENSENPTNKSEISFAEFRHIYPSHPEYEMKPHQHSDVEIIYIEKGTFHLMLNGEQHSLSTSDIVYIDGNTLHSGIPHDCSYYCVSFSKKNLFNNFPAIFNELANYGCCILRSNYHAITCISAAIVENRCKEQGFVFRIYSNIFAFFSELSYAKKIEVTSNKSHKNISLLINAIEIIEKNYNSKITLKELADACNMTSEYFCSFFKKRTGLSPFEYINSYRVERACELLLYKEVSVTEAAFLCGFNDLGHFIKVFKKIKKVSPGKYSKYFYEKKSLYNKF